MTERAAERATAHGRDATHADLRVQAPGEMAAYLEELAAARTRVQLASPAGRSLTTYLSVADPTRNLLGFGFETPLHSEARALAGEASDDVVAVAYLGAVKLQFDLEGLVFVQGELGASLRCGLPTQMYRFQRRETFRVQPLGAFYPRLVLPAGAASPAGEVTMRVLNLSIGGLAVQQGPQVRALTEGQHLPTAGLELERGSRLNLALRVQHCEPADGGGEQVGCAFVEPDTATTRALQLYIDQTQKRQRLIKR